jgi:hypothetical protein
MNSECGTRSTNIATIKINDTNPKAVTGLVKVDCVFVEVFMFISPYLLVQLIQQSISALNKIQSTENIKLLHVSALGVLSSGGFLEPGTINPAR